MIEVKNLIKNYGKDSVLKGISFNVKEKEIFGLLGANGAGKTTTLECLEGLRSYDSGQIIICGKNPQKAAEMGIIGIQLQSSSLPSNISVADAMKLFCYWNNTIYREDLLQTLGLNELKDKTYKTLSTGQKRRLHLALALTHNPKILFLDEPTAGLDVEARVMLHQEIKKLNKKGTTIILSSHDMAEVEGLCNRIGIIVQGEIKCIGKPGDIVLKVEEEQLIKIKWDKEVVDFNFKELSEQQIKEGVYYFKINNLLLALKEIVTYTEENNLQLLDLNVENPSLEERFIEITKGGNN